MIQTLRQCKKERSSGNIQAKGDKGYKKKKEMRKNLGEDVRS